VESRRGRGRRALLPRLPNRTVLEATGDEDQEILVLQDRFRIRKERGPRIAWTHAAQQDRLRKCGADVAEP
jgi:hypothetical protein